ncbi:beta-N-acetylglucosaminidase domain-containing protein [Rubritalea tangerina]|uniref:Beta-N-acetylglucosaminidase domain-containing protein n=2 Tax=Rubritalea tangerina TaxID=430798 RepID=A0ABW4ZAD9_9BACT
MNKRIQHTALTALSLLAPLSVSYAESPFEIYPTPQKIAYQNSNFTITPEVNVILEKGVDSYTKLRLNKVLKNHGLTPSFSNKLVSGKTNILLGINASGEAVDQYFNKHVAHKEKFFEKNDSHIVSVKDNIIAVLGDDTDSTFYGLTTLKHVFNQLTDKQIQEFRVDDFSDVKHRGFIEGYYGNPWSNQDRAELMKFGGDYKLNTYFFAPKDDIYHNKKWRELYPPRELAEIKKLAKAGNESKCKYVYALHTFMHQPVRFDTEANYQNDLKIIKAKFVQLLENDVRAFSILADDAGVPPQGPETYVKLLEDLTEWLIEQQKTYPDLVTDIPFCPNDYMGNGSSQQLRVTNQAPDSTSIIMTGGRIWGEVSEHFTSNFIKNVASPGHAGRPSYLWINWPCSDNSKQHLIMGGNDTFLHPKVTPSNIQGIILNPMQQAEANKSALFAIADYSWNIWSDKDQADQNWHDSFKYMNHGSAEETMASTALREISKHMINQNMDGRVRALQESIELAPKLNTFKDKLKSGTFQKADTASLIKEFEALQKAAAYYKANPGNERTRDQIIYWLDCWQDTTTAAISYLHSLNAILDKDSNATWNHYSSAHAAFEKSKDHPFWYLNHYQYAEVGVQHIVPFIKTLGAHTGNVVSRIVDPSKVVRNYITNREAAPSGKIDAILDYNPSTGVVYKNPTRITKGEYIGLLYNHPQKITSITFDLATKANPKDTFSKAIVEFTKDGKTWKPLSSKVYEFPNKVEISDLTLVARGVRMIATEVKENTWLGVNEVSLTLYNPDANGYTNTNYTLETELSLDRASLHPIKGIKLQPKQFIGIKLDRIKDPTSIDKEISNKQLSLQVSANEVEWLPAKTDKLPDARYIRLVNTTSRPQSVDIQKFEVHSNEIQPLALVKSHAPIRDGSSLQQMFDGNFNSTAIFNGSFSEGNSIVFDLGQAIHIDNLKYVVLDTETDHIRDAKFQLSLDGETWVDAFETSRVSDDANAKPQDNGYTHGSLSKGVIPISHAYLEGKKLNSKARFVRILATKSYHPRWVRISEILINNGQYVRPVNDPTFASKPIEIKGHGPEMMVDGDLNTSYRPNTQNGKIKTGGVIYKLSENTAVKQINVVQHHNPKCHATIQVRTGSGWVKLGPLSESLNKFDTSSHQHIFEVKILWNGEAPSIYEAAFIPKN